MLRVECFVIAIAACAAACKSEPKEMAPADKPAATPSASAAASPKTPSADSTGVVRIAADVRAEEEYGYAIAGHQNRVVITAYKRNQGSGSVFVYALDGASTTLEAELSAEKAQLGNGIAFDGQRIAVGAMFADGERPDTGAVFVFERAEDGWSKPFKLVSRQSKPDESFGIGVVLAGDSVIVSNSAESGGSLFVFEKSGARYEQKSVVPFDAPDGPGELMAAAGDWLVVGAQNAGELEEQGIVHTFAKRDGALVADTKLADSPPAKEAHFGGAVALAPRLLAVASETHVSLFELESGRFRPSARITPPETIGLADGALALGGDRLAIGLPLVDEGRVLVYQKRGGAWVHERTLRAPDGKKNAWFGFSLAFTDKQLVIGAPFADERAGAAYVVAL